MDRAEARTLRRLLRRARPAVYELPLSAVGAPSAERAAVSADLMGELASTRGTVEVRPIEAPAIGRDLCRPLHAADVVARGKHFAATPPIQPPPAPGDAGKAPVKGGKRRKAYKEHRVPGDVLRQTLTVWDLLLPLLHPPVSLDEGAPSDLPHKLYHYQVDGIRFLCESRSALLADEMGTGKTVMSTVAMRALFRRGEIQRALVVCPLSVLGVWDRHLAEWAPDLAVTVVHGTARTRWADWRCPAHVYLTTYDTLRGDLLGAKQGSEALLPREIAQRFELVLLDEAQGIKNADSGRSQAVFRLEPRFRWALSGTPIENRLGDLVSLFRFVRPRLLPAEDLTPELASELIAPYVKRRTKREVMRELPPKIRQDEWLELDPAQRTAYEKAEALGRQELEELGEKVSRIHVFSLISKLKAICNFAPGTIDSPKLRTTLAKVEEIRASGQKVLIFSQWVQEGVDKLSEALADYGVVSFDARLSSTQREAAVQRFREDPDAGVFVATVKSAGVGLTLTEASYVIHFDHWWNPAWMWQAEDRAHRRGQQLPVNVYSLWMADTIEARIYELLQRKGMLHEEVVDGLSEGAEHGQISVGDWLDVLGIDSPRSQRVFVEDRG